MVHKISQHSSQCTDILNELLMLIMAITFIAGNLKGLPDERINSIKTPNHSSTPNLDYYGTQQEQNLMEAVLNKIKLHLIMEKQKTFTLFMRQVKALTSAIIRHYKIFYLVQLLRLKILIQISTNILDIGLELIDMEVFHFQVVELAETQ